MQIRAAATMAATLLTTLALTGCTSSGGTVTTAQGSLGPIASTAPTSPAPTSPAPTSAAPPPPSASPSPSQPSVSELNQQVALTKIAVRGASFSGQDRSGLPPLDVCGGVIAAYNLVKAANVWAWSGLATPIFKEAIFGFQSITGADVVAQAKALSTSCKSHNVTIGIETIKITVTGPMALSAPAGVDGFYAFCETQVIIRPAIGSGVQLPYCTAVMSLGPVAVFLIAGGANLAAVHGMITNYLPPTVKALVKAVP